MKTVKMVVVVGLIVLGVVYAGTRAEELTLEDKNKQVVKSAIAAMNNKDWQFMEKLYSPQFVQHHAGTTDTSGYEDFELECRLTRHRLPTARMEIMHIIAEGNTVAVRLKTVVRYKAAAWDGPHKAAKTEFTEIDLYRIEAGRIVEEWSEYDTKDWEHKLRPLIAKGIFRR